MTTAPTEPKPPIQRLVWGRVIGFIGLETVSFAKKVTIIGACLLTVSGVVTASISWVNSARRSADAAEAQYRAQIEAAKVLGATEERKAQAEADRIELERVAAETKKKHDAEVEAKLKETRDMVDANSIIVRNIAAEQKQVSAQLKAMRLDVAALLKEKGIPPHPVAMGGTP